MQFENILDKSKTNCAFHFDYFHLIRQIPSLRILNEIIVTLFAIFGFNRIFENSNFFATVGGDIEFVAIFCFEIAPHHFLWLYVFLSQRIL